MRKTLFLVDYVFEVVPQALIHHRHRHLAKHPVRQHQDVVVVGLLGHGVPQNKVFVGHDGSAAALFENALDHDDDP